MLEEPYILKFPPTKNLRPMIAVLTRLCRATSKIETSSEISRKSQFTKHFECTIKNSWALRGLQAELEGQLQVFQFGNHVRGR